MGEIEEVEKRTPQYLEFLLDEIRPYVGDSFWDKWVRVARARAGGKAKPRKPEAPDAVLQLALRSLTPRILKGLSFEDLDGLHMRIHEVASGLEGLEAEEKALPTERDVHIPGALRTVSVAYKPLDWEDLKRVHALLARELQRREKQHKVSGALDEQSAELEARLVKDTDERLAHLQEALEKLPEVIVWKPDWASISGGEVYAKGREPHDTDWVIREKKDDFIKWFIDEKSEEYDPALILKLERLTRELFNKEGEYSPSAYGPNWDSVPVYHLGLIRVPRFELREVSEAEPQFAEMLYKAAPSKRAEAKLRSAPEEIRRQAEESLKEDEVRPDRFFFPMKPWRAIEPVKPQTLEAFFGFFEDEDFPVWCSTKRDGNRLLAFQNKGKVKIISDDGRDVTDKLPDLVERFAKFSSKDFIIDLEAERWEEGQHYPREAARAAIETGKGQIVANCFDIVYFGEDLHKRPFGERYAILEKLKWDQVGEGALKDGKPLALIPHYKAENRSELERMTRRLCKVPGSEGVVAKRDDGIYPLRGEPTPEGREWVKFHRASSVKAIVLERVTTKGGAYLYWYGLPIRGDLKVVEERELDGKRYLVIGKTFATAQKLEASSPIEIETETLNHTEDRKRGAIGLTAWVPNVMGTYEGRPDSVGAAVERARDYGVLQKKVIDEDGEIEYLPTKPAKILKAETEKLPARYLVSPHAEMVASGEKKLILSADADRKYINKEILIVSNDQAFAKVKLGEPRLIDLAEFEKLKPRHKVTDTERREWWPDKKNLWAFPFVLVEAYEPSRPVELPRGARTWIKEVELRKAEDEALYPPEDKTYRYVVQSHYRGRSNHKDLRLEHDGYLIGFTLLDQMPEEVKEPVVTLALAKKYDAQDIFKIDWSKGEIKKRQIRGGVIRRADIRVEFKAKEIPSDWFDVEGATEKTEPGERPPAGATKEFPGVFHIIDRGNVEYGTQKPYFREFFLSGGKLREGRWLFRQVGREISKASREEFAEEYLILAGFTEDELELGLNQLREEKLL